MSDDYALIVPRAGKEKETARLLLELATRARDVKTNTDGPGVTFVVPAWLAKQYNQSGETEVTGVKRRGRPPGRPTKAVPAQAQAEATTESED